jgi:hypothetical protein
MKRLTLFVIMLFCSAALAQDLPRIAVYVTGEVPENEKRALGTHMLSSLINSKRYMGIERSAAFLAEIEKEQVTQRSGAIDDGQISELGRQFGVKYICIADIIPAFGAWQISARIVDVETAVVVFIGSAFSPLRSAQDLTNVSEEVVKIMFQGQTAPQPQAVAETQTRRAEPARTTQNVMDDGRKQVEAVPPTPAKPPKPVSFWAAVGLDVLGAGLLVYGFAENGNIGPYNDKAGYDKVSSSAKTRNILYGIGTAALLGGVSVHIFF